MSKQKHPRKKKINEKKAIPQKKSFTKITALVVFIAIILFLVLTNIFKHKPEDQEYIFKKQGELTFLTPDNQVEAKIDIQIADNEFDRELGLMYRKKMEENQGMLFIFPKASIQTFWMRNTFIPLDMIFISPDKTIVTIRKDTRTLSDSTYASTKPAQYVLEVNAGFCNKFSIHVGDKVKWKKTNAGVAIQE